MSLMQDLHQSVRDYRANVRGKRSIADWVAAHGVVPDKLFKPYSFEGREYLVQILNDPHPMQVCMKAPQGGYTLAFMHAEFAYLEWHQGLTTIYTMPREKDIAKLNRLKLRPILRHCKRIKQLRQQSGVKDQDSMAILSIGESHLLISPTFSSSEGISDTAHSLVNDEVDRSDLVTVGRFRSRLQGQVNPVHKQFSNPSAPGFGIDAEYDLSDQHTWQIKCPFCAAWQTQEWEPEETWRHSTPPFIRRRSEINKAISRGAPEDIYVYACRHCHRELVYAPDIKAQWVAAYDLPRMVDDVKHDVRGYHWIAPNAWGWMSAADVIDNFNKYRRRSVEDAYNFGIGITCRDSISKLAAAQVRACVNPLLKWSAEPDHDLVLAADQGNNEHHIVIAQRIVEGDRFRLRVRHVECHKGRLFDGLDDNGAAVRGRLADLRAQCRPAIGIIDAQPNLELSLSECRRAQGFLYRVWYVDSLRDPVKWREAAFAGNAAKYDPDKIDFVVTANQTAMFDWLARMVKETMIEFPPLEQAPGDIGADIIKHITALVRVARETPGGRQGYIWHGSRYAHIANALVYAIIGCQGIELNRPQSVIMPGIIRLNA